MKNQLTYGLLCAALMVLSLPEQAFAQCNSDGLTPTGEPCNNVILTAVPFLRIPPNARSGAMGDVGMAISADPNAMHYNASNLVFAQKDVGIGLTYTPWLQALGVDDVYLAYATGYYKPDDRQAVGASLRYFSLGDIQFTNDQGEPLQLARPREFEFKASYARKLSENFSAAVGAKYIFSDLVGGTGNGVDIDAINTFAADISATYTAPFSNTEYDSRYSLALAITNIGPKVRYGDAAEGDDFIPTNLGFGSSVRFGIDEYNAITLALDINKLLVPTTQFEDNGTPIQNDEGAIAGIFSSFGDAPGGFGEELREFNYSFGVEYWYDNQFAVRTGYYYEDQNKGNRRFLTAGIGLRYSQFGLDFSYLVPTTNQRNPLDNTLRFSLVFDLGAIAPEDARMELGR